MQLCLKLHLVSLTLRFGLVLGIFIAPRKDVPVIAVGFNYDTIAKVEANLLQIATHSWELGTAAQALTELHTPSISVFEQTGFPPPSNLTTVEGNATALLNIAYHTRDQKNVNTLTLIDGDGAVGDPASLGVSILLANWTRSNLSDLSFAQDARQQLTYLTDIAPRTDDGAISHRNDQVQLWADFVYMAPPFIAYYGALEGGSTEAKLLQEAYDQCRLYRNYLRDPTTGLWNHIVLGNGTDFRLWGTGNAWAAAGMLRVLETLRHSDQSFSFAAQQADLVLWIHEILVASWQYQQANGTLLNVINDPTTFPDSSSTALLAAVTYRLATRTGNYTLIPNANSALTVIRNSVDENGWLLNTVDPETFNTPSLPGQFSPEGQAFVLLLHAAWRDFNEYLSGTLPA
ncbi:Six-hairpin glycosidase [Irpex rosettiformis]|uniref:Six-hairpin glycosidase n=1 Tax=Irpex rosettiformis TaxID=378272 RepID=A0ACB8UCF5_9APHY|nr:Six-hairpin glycosidase [Irpex rosettiformis]